MSPLSQRFIGMFVLVALPAVAVAQDQEQNRFVAEVTAHTLLVRSGPSQNYYVVEELNAGDRVTVTGQEHGWYRILPPSGCYSLVSKNYVDLDRDGKTGVVNTNALRVRAGSDMERHRYAVQLKLDKGAEVKVVGETQDGYLKIEPPAGAYLWISADYVTEVPGERLAMENGSRRSEPIASKPEREAKPAVAEEQPVAARPEPVDNEPSMVDETPSTVESDATVAVTQTGPGATTVEETDTESEVDAEPAIDYQAMLDEIDADLEDELAKPPTERQFDSLVTRYREIAAQEYDEIARLIAERRITQLEYGTEAADAIERVRRLATDVSRSRRDALAARSNLKRVSAPIERGFDAKGELRESMIYQSTPGPRRYRLVDPKLGVPRTLAYVEIPADANIDVSRYLGRIVGIRARNKYLQTGDVDPITIVVAELIVPLDETPEASILELGPDTDDVHDEAADTTLPADDADQHEPGDTVASID